MNGPLRMRLLKPHTHRGINHSADDVITVSPDTADWLTRRGVARVVLEPQRPPPCLLADETNPESDAGNSSGYSTPSENQHG